MDHKEFVALLSRDQKQQLTARSDWPGLPRLAVHWGLIATLGVLIAAQVPYWPLLMLPQGILIVFTFTLQHETSHRTAFRSLWLNKAVGWGCGFLVGLPPEWFRYFHFDHHRYTQDPDRDPELASPKPSTLRGYLWQLTGLSIWRGHVLTLWRNALGHCQDGFVPPQGRTAVQLESQIMLGLYGLLFLSSIVAASPALLAAWLIPIVLGQPFLRAYLAAEHTACPLVPNMLLNSRTTLTGPFIKLLAWNMPYHAEHHCFPAVPFHRLPDLHHLLSPHLGTVSPGYIAFHRERISAFRVTHSG